MQHSVLNKVVFHDEVLIDISDSTVIPEKLLLGTVAYNAAGERIVGTLVVNNNNGGE